MEVTDVLSIIAIIAATGCVVFEVFISKKLNRINLENKYYEKIFDDILLYQIPKARIYFVYIGGKLEGTKELQSAMVNLRKNSLFFKYKDLNFYNDLCNLCMHIEDFLMESEGKMSKEEFKKFEVQIDSKLEELYTLISNNSAG